MVPLLTLGSSIAMAPAAGVMAADSPAELSRLIVELSGVDESAFTEQVEELGGSVVAVLDKVPYAVVEGLSAHRAAVVDGVESIQHDFQLERQLDILRQVVDNTAKLAAR